MRDSDRGGIPVEQIARAESNEEPIREFLLLTRYDPARSRKARC